MLKNDFIRSEFTSNLNHSIFNVQKIILTCLTHCILINILVMYMLCQVIVHILSKYVYSFVRTVPYRIVPFSY